MLIILFSLQVDLNGKRYLWMGVALLPFVDEVRLLKALDERRDRLTDEERHRNVRRPVIYFVHADTPIGQTITALYNPASVELAAGKGKKSEEGSGGSEYDGTAPPDATLINAALTQGIAGHVWPDRKHVCLPGHRLPSGVPGLLPDIPAAQQHAVSALFENPPYPFGHVFPARLLDSVSSCPFRNHLFRAHLYVLSISPCFLLGLEFETSNSEGWTVKLRAKRLVGYCG